MIGLEMVKDQGTKGALSEAAHQVICRAFEQGCSSSLAVQHGPLDAAVDLEKEQADFAIDVLDRTISN